MKSNIAALALGLAFIAGCDTSEPHSATPPPPVVPVATPAERSGVHVRTPNVDVDVSKEGTRVRTTHRDGDVEKKP